jgi:hypothetical protein
VWVALVLPLVLSGWQVAVARFDSDLTPPASLVQLSSVALHDLTGARVQASGPGAPAGDQYIARTDSVTTSEPDPDGLNPLDATVTNPDVDVPASSSDEPPADVTGGEDIGSSDGGAVQTGPASRSWLFVVAITDASASANELR